MVRVAALDNSDRGSNVDGVGDNSSQAGQLTLPKPGTSNNERPETHAYNKLRGGGRRRRKGCEDGRRL